MGKKKKRDYLTFIEASFICNFTCNMNIIVGCTNILFPSTVMLTLLWML